MARNNPWKLAFDTWSLAIDATAVIAMRTTTLAVMDAAAIAEAQLMVTEKIEAATALQLRAMTGGLGRSPRTAAHRALKLYRDKVRKNRTRLGRPKRG